MPLAGGPSTFFSFSGLCDPSEHFAIGFGAWRHHTAPLVRIHSECATGDIFRSALCDCGDQLEEAIRVLRAQHGVLMYLRQEGRGIGLYNKLDAYSIQADGVDTFSANEMLGLERDGRSYRAAAQMLRALGLNQIQLYTNNPDKRQQLQELGISVIGCRSTGVFVRPENRRYLHAKARAGHQLTLQTGWGDEEGQTGGS